MKSEVIEVGLSHFLVASETQLALFWMRSGNSLNRMVSGWAGEKLSFPGPTGFTDLSVYHSGATEGSVAFAPVTLGFGMYNTEPSSSRPWLVSPVIAR